jgi:hypothetical protein
VARSIFGNISKTRGLLGISVDYSLITKKPRGLFANLPGFGFQIYFSMEKLRWTQSMAHGTSAGRGRRWTDHHGQPWSSPELGLAAAPSHGCLPRGGEKKEGATGTQFCLVPWLGRRRGGGAPVAGLQLEAAAMRARQRGGGKSMVWEFFVGVGGPFIRLGEGHRGSEGGVTAGDTVVFSGRVILRSSQWVKAQLEGGK